MMINPMEQLTDSVVNIRNVLERGVEVSVILVYLSKMIANTMIYDIFIVITTSSQWENISCYLTI